MSTKDATPTIPVLVVGAGVSGIATACQLRRQLSLPASDILLIDRQSDIGGTWHINRYPGVACDVPAVFYSFSFAMNPRWTSFHPGAKEIKEYLNEVVDRFGIRSCVRTDVDVGECRWMENLGLWQVELRYLRKGMGDLSEKERKKIIAEKGEEGVVEKTELVRAKIVCSAVGGLVEPKGWPDDIPGIEGFEGKMFHSARWDYDVDLKDKDVVVVGTGCSAAQFVPRLTTEYGAKSVTQLMRSPPWVEPRVVPLGGEEGWSKWAPTILSTVPGLNRLLRIFVFLGSEQGFALFGGAPSNAKLRAKHEKNLLEHMKRTVPPEYHEILTPDYGVGCKRRIFDATWFPGLSDPKIDLTTLPLTSVHPRSVTLGPGRTYPDPKNTSSQVSTEAKEIPADVIVLANGFDVTKWLHPLRVTGRGGIDLVTEMDARGGPQAYQGTAMDGFPNFFIIFGPNTATGHSSVILATENMIMYALKFIKPLLRGEWERVEVRQEAEVGYTRDLQEALSKTVWMSGGCRSWYFTADGWNSTMYPFSQFYFGWRCMFPIWKHWDIKYTRKGLWLRSIRIVMRLLALTVLIIGTYRARQAGMTLTSLKSAFFAIASSQLQRLRTLVGR